MKQFFTYKSAAALLLVAVVLLSCLYLNGCGKQKAVVDDYVWQHQIDSLKIASQRHETKMKQDSIKSDSFLKQVDSLKSIINNHEPETVPIYKDKHIKDSVINSLSVNELIKQITGYYK